MQNVTTLIAMLLAIAAVGLMSRAVSVPPAILLVAAGIGLGVLPGVHTEPTSPDLILAIFLPALLYKEAFHTSWLDFVRWLRPILMLAVGLVGLTIVAVAFTARALLPDLMWPVAFMLGAIVSPTDTVAAMSVIHRIRVPRRITAILGGESLVNDATALVALQFTLIATFSGVVTWWGIGLNFVWAALGGVGVGLVVGFIANAANRMVRENNLLFTLSLLAPFVAFVGAHALHASGVVAVVTAGFFVAWRIHTIRADTRYALFTVWRLMAFLIDGCCFLLTGMEIPRLMRGFEHDDFNHLLIGGIAVTLVVIAVRMAYVWITYFQLWVHPATREREGGWPAPRNIFLAGWCGMRGAVSLAAALAVPVAIAGTPLAGRDDIIFCTICVIVGTLLIQGLSLPGVIRWLGIGGDDDSEAEETRLARVSLIQAALTRLDDLRGSAPHLGERVAHVERIYTERLSLLIGERGAAPATGGQPRHLFGVERAALKAERARLLELRDGSLINDLVLAALQEELDIAEMRLQQQGAKEATEARSHGGT